MYHLKIIFSCPIGVNGETRFKLIIDGHGPPNQRGKSRDRALQVLAFHILYPCPFGRVCCHTAPGGLQYCPDRPDMIRVGVSQNDERDLRRIATYGPDIFKDPLFTTRYTRINERDRLARNEVRVHETIESDTGCNRDLERVP